MMRALPLPTPLLGLNAQWARKKIRIPSTGDIRQCTSKWGTLSPFRTSEEPHFAPVQLSIMQ
jgi:hypothetical protein